MTSVHVTTAARRMCREVNSGRVHPGAIYWVDLDTGVVGEFVSTWAADQPPLEWREVQRQALYRVSHGRVSESDCQRFLDTLGEDEG